MIACALEVHRTLGPGLLESVYEKAMCIELEAAGLAFECQLAVPIRYKGQAIGTHRLDLLVSNQVVVEIKSVDRFDPVFEAQILTYMRHAAKPHGLLINFNSRLLKDGIRRFVL